MRVLLVAAMPFPTGHGSQVYVATQAAALAEAGHDVTLAVYGAGEGADPPGVRVLRTPTRPGTRLASGPQLAKVREDPALLGLVRRAAVGVDVVHAHHVEAAVIARLVSRAPVVYDAHASLADELPDWFPRGRAVARWGGRQIDRVVPGLVAATIALSEGGAARLRAAGAPRVVVVPPPLDPRPLQGADPAAFRAAWGLDGRPWVAYAGNLDPYQRWPLVVDAVGRRSDVGLLMLVSGDPAAARRAAAALPADRVRIVAAPFALARDGLAAATVAVVPRTRCAGFPIKLLNQLALGVPTLAARGAVDPMPGVVFFEPEDAGSLAAAIGALVADGPRRAALAREGAACVADVHAPRAAAAALAEVYREVLASSSVTPGRVSS